MSPKTKKLLDQVRYAIRRKHYFLRTEQNHIGWISRFILYRHKRHSLEMDGAEIDAFLTYLAVERRFAASNRNQALSAILFLYRGYY